MLLAQPKQVLDPDLERAGDGRCVEGGADLRQRDCHGRSLFCGNLCGGAANALDVALLAALRRIRPVFEKGHRSGSVSATGVTDTVTKVKRSLRK
jgi:hypothetical protein